MVEDIFSDLGAFSKHVLRLGRLSMPACDWVRFEHFQAIVRARGAAALRDFVRCLALGDVPDADRPYVYGARLVAPSKPDDPDAHRPIGAGLAARRLSSGFLAHQLRHKFGERLAPHQLGVGVPRGPGAVAAALRLALEKHPLWVAVKIDFRNAFNECDRAAMLHFIARWFPEVLLFVMAAYGVPSYITALGPDGWVRYLSRAGCTQGCGLGPLCFAAALHIVLERVVGSFPDCAVVALHDDVGIAGPPARVRRALMMLVSEARAEAGLTPTGHKFTFYCDPRACEGAALSDCKGIEDDILAWTPVEAMRRGRRCTMQHDGLVQAGVPIGTRAYALARMRERVTGAERVHEQTRLLECVQSAYLITRYSLSRKMDYHTGAVGSRVMGGLRARWWEDDGSDAPGAMHDRQMSQTLAVLLASPYLPRASRQAARADALPAHVSAQAVLPPKRSGLGLAPARQTADACFVGQSLAVLSFLFTHSAALHLPADLGELQGLAWGQQLAAAVARLPAPRTGDGAGVARTLDGLLSGSPTSRSQHRHGGRLRWDVR